MHLHLILISLILCASIRCFIPFRLTVNAAHSWAQRWQQAMIGFLIPPLLLFMTALAVLCMGHHGRMLGLSVGWLGCHLALGFLGWAIALLGWRFWQGWRSLHQLKTHPKQTVGNVTAHLLESTIPYVAQIGFRKPQLVVSQGFLDRFPPDQIEAVMVHEQAHTHFQDTFWFFWLGWLRQITAWLPNSQFLWEELLLLREMRADHWAASRVDGLLLAEALVEMVQWPVPPAQDFCAAFDTPIAGNRLEERIDALLSKTEITNRMHPIGWLSLLIIFAPFLTLGLHH